MRYPIREHPQASFPGLVRLTGLLRPARRGLDDCTCGCRTAAARRSTLAGDAFVHNANQLAQAGHAAPLSGDRVGGSCLTGAMTTVSNMQDDELPDEIYHYTDATGLLGILGDQKLWATHAAYLNDSEEVVQGVRMIQTVANSLAKKPPPPEVIDEFKAEHMAKIFLLKILARMFGSKLPEQVQEQVDLLFPRYGPFVTCFSEERDQLSQWRGYGRTAGYAIKFNGKELRKYIINHGDNADHSRQITDPSLVNKRTFVKMVYDPSELEASTRDHIVDLWSKIGLIVSKLAAGDIQPPTESEISSIREIFPSLTLTALRLKHRGFIEDERISNARFREPG